MAALRKGRPGDDANKWQKPHVVCRILDVGSKLNFLLYLLSDAFRVIHETARQRNILAVKSRTSQSKILLISHPMKPNSTVEISDKP